jgi:pimeloyl-ACP methyl ester carboxylesterase
MQRSAKPGSFTDEEIAHYRAAWVQPGALRAMINWYRSAFRSGLESVFSASELPRISVPTLMLWGKQDTALSHEMAQPSIELCKKGRLVFLENATHWVQHEEAEAVREYLLEFLDE